MKATKVEHAPPRRSFGLRLGLLIGAMVSAGCDSVLGSDQAAFADEAQVVVEGELAPNMHVVTSTNFTATPDVDTGDLEIDQLIASDTTAVAASPFDRVYTIRGADRFMVRLVSPDLEVTADIRIRLLLDGHPVFDQTATMRDASLQYIAFYDPVF